MSESKLQNIAPINACSEMEGTAMVASAIAERETEITLIPCIIGRN